MTIQYAIVLTIVAAAAVYFALSIYRKARSFSPKNDCGDDCGCGTRSRSVGAKH